MTDRHLLPEQLAEHAEGLFPPEDARAADDHLRRCAECRETAAALEAVSTQLAAAPKSVPTPPEVVTRVDRALAAEHADRRPPESAGQGLVERLRARMPALAAAAAGVAVVAFAGWVVGTGGLSGDDAATESAADAPRQADQDAGEGADGQEVPEEEAGPEDNAAPDARDESADEFSAEGESVPDASLLVDPAAIEEQVLAVVRNAEDRDDGAEAGDACGSRLAAEEQADLVGTAPARLEGQGEAAGAVVVVLGTGTADVVQGWVLPSCDAAADDALAPALTVPVE